MSVILSEGEAVSLAEHALRKVGYSAGEAHIIALHLVDSDLSGYPAMGLSRVLSIAEHPKAKKPRTAISFVHETPVSALIDGGNNVGFYAVHRATEIAVEKARAGKFALVGVHNCYMSGRSAYYLEIAARAGFVGMHFASGAPLVVPPGGKTPAFGTNPIAFGLPCDPHPFIFDMGTAALNSGDITLASRLQQLLPEGAAIDAEGQPTRDPEAARAGGGILPFGGHKGYGLSLTVQALGLLAGSALAQGKVQDYANLLIVFDPALLMPAAQFKKYLAELLQRVKAASREPGPDQIRIPSERGFAERERRRKEGIALDPRLYERISAL